MTQFIYTPENWLENAKTQVIKTAEGRNKLKSKMNMLSGDQTPEQLMIYLKDFDDKIRKITALTAPEKLDILRPLVNMEEQKIVSRVEG